MIKKGLSDDTRLHVWGSQVVRLHVRGSQVVRGTVGGNTDRPGPRTLRARRDTTSTVTINYHFYRLPLTDGWLARCCYDHYGVYR